MPSLLDAVILAERNGVESPDPEPAERDLHVENAGPAYPGALEHTTSSLPNLQYTRNQ